MTREEVIKAVEEFENLVGANLTDADLRGLNLSNMDLEGAKLEDADLRGANLEGAKLEDANLRGANLKNADLRGANLSDTNLDNAILIGANLDDAILRGASLKDTSLANVSLKNVKLPSAPVVEELHQKILDAIKLNPNLFSMDTWHKEYNEYNSYVCATSHCRAGWTIHLAGAEGYVLEENIGSDAAGALITLTSCPWLEKVPNWHASAEEALADIRRCAEIEKELNKA
jgi:hypothetical protein